MTKSCIYIMYTYRDELPQSHGPSWPTSHSHLVIHDSSMPHNSVASHHRQWLPFLSVNVKLAGRQFLHISAYFCICAPPSWEAMNREIVRRGLFYELTSRYRACFTFNFKFMQRAVQEALYRWTSVKGGAHTRFVNSLDIHASTKHIWAPPLTKV